MKILFIDDSKFVYAVVKEICDQYKWDLVWAENGQIGYEKIATDRSFDIVLLDWNMPVLDGIGFLKKYREKYEVFPVPVVMMTTENSPEKISQAVSLGVSEYIMKPFTNDILQFKIQAVLESLGKSA